MFIALVLGVFGTACAATGDPAGPGVRPAPTSPPSAGHAETGHDNAATGSPALPSGHVHGVAVNPADAKVYLATHDGLFRYDRTGPKQVGPVIDLMGFTVAGPNHFYASGHPGPGVDLPQPVGLIESTDAGRSWTPLSRQGESDFHTLAASKAGVAGFDGAIRLTRWRGPARDQRNRAAALQRPG
ncbi:MAG: hypothetical protein ACLGIF_05620 [Actinomycetes bacterium]